jgi:hypothetical protein
MKLAGRFAAGVTGVSTTGGVAPFTQDEVGAIDYLHQRYNSGGLANCSFKAPSLYTAGVARLANIIDASIPFRHAYQSCRYSSQMNLTKTSGAANVCTIDGSANARPSDVL